MDRSWLRLLSLGGAVAIWLAMPAAKGAEGYQHFTWHKAAEGIWLGVTPPASFISGNSVIIALPEGGSIVVDPHITAFTAREIIAKAKEVAGPVKYLVNTHLHNDHTQGNSAFRKEFPSIEIIAHANTCWGAKEKAVPRSRYRLGKLAREVDEIKKNRAGVTDPKIGVALDRIIAGNELYLEDGKSLEWVLPSTCLDMKPGDKKTLASGARVVELYYFGRAHTAGDLVILLPKERILVNGDLWAAGGGLGGDGRDGSILEAPATLRRIAALDFDTVLPGHGDPFRGKESLEASIRNAENLIARVEESYAAGDYVERTLELVKAPARAASANDVSKYVPYMSAPAEAGWQRAVIRTYEELELRKQLGLPLTMASQP